MGRHPWLGMAEEHGEAAVLAQRMLRSATCNHSIINKRAEDQWSRGTSVPIGHTWVLGWALVGPAEGFFGRRLGHVTVSRKLHINDDNGLTICDRPYAPFFPATSPRRKYVVWGIRRSPTHWARHS